MRIDPTIAKALPERAQPRALPCFGHINRYWDPSNHVWAAKLLPGEYYVSLHGEMIATVLGSCISACIRDVRLGIGGMNHFMLPGEADNGGSGWGGAAVSAATRYGTFAMEHLINNILKQGGRREDLEVKLFGGGRVLQIDSNVGLRNAEFAKAYLAREKLALAAEDLLGPYPRKIKFFPESGRVRVKKLREMHNDTIKRREERYFRDLERKPVATAEVELF